MDGQRDWLRKKYRWIDEQTDRKADSDGTMARQKKSDKKLSGARKDGKC